MTTDEQIFYLYEYTKQVSPEIAASRDRIWLAAAQKSDTAFWTHNTVYEAYKKLSRYEANLEVSGVKFQDIPLPGHLCRRLCTIKESHVILQWSKRNDPKHAEFYTMVKGLMGSRWNEFILGWVIPRAAAYRLHALLEENAFVIHGEFTQEDRRIPERRAGVSTTALWVKWDLYDPDFREIHTAVKGIAGRKWNKKDMIWEIPKSRTPALLPVLSQFNFVSEESLIEVTQKQQTSLTQSRSQEDDFFEIPELGRPPYGFQYTGARYLLDRLFSILGDEMGLGKAQPLYSKILTPGGWKTMGEMKIGDDIINVDGGISQVTGVFPQGKQDVYEVTFSDGSVTHCGFDHLWEVHTTTQRFRNATHRYQVAPLNCFKNTLHFANKNRKFYVPVTRPITGFKKRDLYIPAYILGVLLGDGSLSGGGSVVFNTDDIEIFQAVQDLLPSGHCIHTHYDPSRYSIVSTATRQKKRKNFILNTLRKLGLMGKTSFTKHIPHDYLFSSIQDRIALLRGLLDTDGYVDKRGTTVQYSTVSPDLRDGVAFLVQSLGGIARISEKIPKGGNGPAYTLTLNLPPGICPFKLPRKRERFKENHKYLPTRGFEKTVLLEKRPCQCISTNAPRGLYLTDECIVTHNTNTTLITFQASDMFPALVITPANVKFVWRDEIAKVLPGRTVQILSGKLPLDRTSQANGARYQSFVTQYAILEKSRYRRGYITQTEFAVLAPELAYLWETDVIIINYDILVDWIPILIQIPYIGMACDEAHALKNKKSLRFKCTETLVKKAKSLYLLTGTAILAKPKEIIALLQLLGVFKQIFGDWRAFVTRYCNGHQKTIYKRGGSIKVWDIDGASHLKELNEILRRECFLRRRTKDVLKDLPPFRRIIYPVELSNKQEYLKGRQERMAYIKDTYIQFQQKEEGAGGKILKQIGELRQIIGRGKVEAACEWIDNFLENEPPEEKLLVFAFHKEVQDAIYKHLKRGTGVRITGGGGKKRQEAVYRFQEDPKIRVIVLSIMAASEGITLTAGATTLFVEYVWTPAVHFQGEKRCILKGQPVLTVDGFKRIENVLQGDSVLTHSGEWKMVKEISSKQCVSTNYLTEIEYTHFDEPLICTHDHKILIKRDQQTEWLEAHKILPGDLLVTHRPLSKTNRINTISFPEEFRIDATVYNQFGVSFTNGRYVPMPEIITLDEDTLFLFGWFLAEGCVHFKARVGWGSTRVGFSGHVKERSYLERIQKKLSEWGIASTLNVKKHKGGEPTNGIELCAWNSELANLLADWFGKNSHTRHIPDFMMVLPDEQIKPLFDAYILGDGYTRKRTHAMSIEWHTVSEQLCSQIAILAMRLGFVPAMAQYSTGRNKGAWQGRFSVDGKPDNPNLNCSTNDHVYHPVKRVTTYHPKKKNEKRPIVYDLTVDDKHSFVVGLATVHNCHRPGQEKYVKWYYLAAFGTFDTYMRKMLAEKAEIVEAVLDGDLDEQTATHNQIDAMVRALVTEHETGEE